MGGIEACLDEIFALGLRDERLKFGGCEGVDKASFGYDEEKDLGACQGRKFIRLLTYVV
jgi:hypothetical protein